MDNFNWEQFSKRIFINADLETAYNAWTQSKELEKWFLSKAYFSSRESKKIPPMENVSSNCKYEWSWFAQNHSESGIITKVNDCDSLEFTFAGNCIVHVKLSRVKNQTLVVLTQKSIPLDNSSKENIRLGCAFGWTFYLTNLKSVLEGGLDLRNKDTEHKGVVNN